MFGDEDMSTKVTIGGIRKKIAEKSRRGEYIYDLSEEEIYAIIADVARKRLKKDVTSIIETCKSGEWKSETKKVDIWSWLNNLVCLLSSDYVTEKKRTVCQASR